MHGQQISYEKARSLMQPGDVIAFGGTSHFSQIIKFATFSEISHVGVILKTQIPGAKPNQFFNQIIESTGKKGVSISRFSQQLDSYNGDVWWLPLSKEIREGRFDVHAFFDFLYTQAHAKKGYDLPQALKSAVDTLESLPWGNNELIYNQEDFSKFFCSELVAAGLEASNAVQSINASEVTPIDLCRWNIYQDNYYLLKGDNSKAISRFNSMSPSHWNI